MATPVSSLPDALQGRLGGRDLIVFDGVCVLCSGFFRFMLKHDRASRFDFATAQSPLGQALYAALSLPTDAFETNLVITNGRIHRKLGAFAAAMAALGWPWRVLSVARYLPRVMSDPLYDLVARNRYRLSGRTETCFLPTPDIRGRFRPDGWDGPAPTV